MGPEKMSLECDSLAGHLIHHPDERDGVSFSGRRVSIAVLAGQFAVEKDETRSVAWSTIRVRGLSNRCLCLHEGIFHEHDHEHDHSARQISRAA